MTITIKHENVTTEVTTTTVVCNEHGEIVFSIYPKVAAEKALAHRQKYPLCAPVQHAVDGCYLIR